LGRVAISLLKTELVQMDSYYDRLSRAMKYIDATNIKIFASIKELGPRNLLEVSRRTRLPFTTVYNRVDKLEGAFYRIAHLVPTHSKLGLVNILVLNIAKPGAEERLTQALKIPNYWWSVTRCEGGFTHHSIHSVPAQHLGLFERYLSQFRKGGLAVETKVLQIGDYEPVNIAFDNFDAKRRVWSFPWDKWLRGLIRHKATRQALDPESYDLQVDKRDLLIVKELQKNARKTFAELAPILGITLQGVKYRFDKLTARGVCRNYSIDIFPYPTDVSAVYDVMLDFASKRAMDRFYTYVPNLLFVIGLSKVLGKSNLIVRVYILESQVVNLLRFLEELVRRDQLKAYSAVRLRLETRTSQTISYEQFEDKKGWLFDYDGCLRALRKIT